MSEVEKHNEYPRESVAGDTNVIEEVHFSENNNLLEVLETEVKANIKNICVQDKKEVSANSVDGSLSNKDESKESSSNKIDESSNLDKSD